MKRRLLSFFRVRELPDPPPGSGPSLATFRASRRFLLLEYLKWIPKQVIALAGLLFALVVFGIIDLPFVEITWWDKVIDFLEGLVTWRGRSVNLHIFFNLIELATVLLFVSQTFVSAFLIKLSWELRWYMVGDESLRIREGLVFLREQTVTIANIQNMTVRQGPIQKLVGIADLEVHTAGGGAALKAAREGGPGESLHLARFRGVEDAEGLRDRIRKRLIRHRGAGLGDADEHVEEAAGAGPSGSELAEAARELLGETRALRRTVRSLALADGAAG